MRYVLNITLNDLRVFFADSGNLFGLIALPVFMTILLGAAFGGVQSGGTLLRVDLLDLDNSQRSQQLIDLLRETNDSIFLCPADQADYNCNLAEDQATLTVEQSIERVRAGDTNALIVIPEGYQQQLEAFEPVAIAYYSDPTATQNDAFLRSLQAVVQQANGAVVAAQVGTAIGDHFLADRANSSIFYDEQDRSDFQSEVFNRAESYIAAQPVQIEFRLTSAEEREATIEETQGFGQSVPGMGTMFVMFTVLAAVSVLLLEKQRWTLQRLVIMPISKAVILGGKILAYVVLGMIQFAIVFVVGLLVGTDFGNDPIAILVVMLSFVLCVTALAIALATVIKNFNQANGVTFLLAMTLAPLGGAWWPLEIAPDFMQVIGHLSPVAWAMDAFRTLIFFDGGLGDVLLEIGVLLGAAAVLFVVGALNFEYE